jgi:hypothetical protein
MHENLSIAVNLINSIDNLADVTTKEVSLRIFNLFLCQAYCDMSLDVPDLQLSPDLLSQPTPSLTKRKPQHKAPHQSKKPYQAAPMTLPYSLSYDSSEAARFPSPKVSTE